MESGAQADSQLERESLRLEALRAYHILDTAADPRFDRLARLVVQTCDVPIALVTLLDENRQWFKARIGLDLPETARAISFCNITISGQDVVVSRDALSDPRYQTLPLVTGEPHIRFYAGAPLRTPEGYNIGTIVALDHRPHPEFGDREIATLRELAMLATDELELWRRIVEAREHEQRVLTRLDEAHAAETGRIEERFRAIIENAPDLLLLLDQTGAVRYASPALPRTLGYDSDDVQGRPVTLLVHPDDRERVRGALGDLRRSPVRAAATEFRLRHEDGSFRTMCVTGQNLLDNPAVGAIVLHARDETEQRRAQEQLARTQERLRTAERMESLGRLAGGIAHDFNNLLTVVLNSLSFALEAAPADAPFRDDIRGAQTAAQRAAALTRQILAFARRQTMAPIDTDLNALAADLLPLLQRLVGEHLEMVFEPAAGTSLVHVDRGQIEQVILNLCANARDAMTDGGQIAIRLQPVTLSADDLRAHPDVAPGRYVQLSVSDTGRGMTADVCARAFEPFYTTKGIGAGTGLGLSVAQGVVQQHHGFMVIESALARGTTVRVFLPAIQQPPTSAPAPRPPANRGEGQLILLADDTDAVRGLTARILTHAGYRVLQARDGVEALELFEQHKDEIALALLDLLMPRLGGAAVLERMHQLRPDLPYLLCSGFVPSGAPIEEGDPHWLHKPYDINTLLERIDRVIRRARAEAE